MDPLSIALALGEFVPGLVRFFKGDRAGEVADKALQVAKRVTGHDDAEQALEAIKANPELQIRLQEAMNPIIIAELEAETRRLESVNATMRAEYQQDDKYVKRWRPTMGYVVTISWGLQMLALSVLIVWKPAEAAGVIAAMAGLSAMWGVALSILGISVAKRSEDKQVAAGFTPPPGLLQAIAQRVAGASGGK